MLHAIVHPADIQDRDGGILLLATLFGMYPFLKKLFADGGYQGPEFKKALARILPRLETEIVKRSDQVKGFVVLPRRWVVERTIAWLNRCRRLVKDWGEPQPHGARVPTPRPQSASCSENFVIPLDVPGRTLEGRPCGSLARHPSPLATPPRTGERNQDPRSGFTQAARCPRPARFTMADETTTTTGIAAHGAFRLPSVEIDGFNTELKDEEGFLGDRACKGAFHDILEKWRKPLRKSGDDPFGKEPSENISKKVLDAILIGDDTEASAVVQSAIEDFAQELAYVTRRFLKTKAWEKTGRIVVGGGFRDSRLGELAIARADIILKAEDYKIEMVPIRYNPDDAGLIGALHLAPSWIFRSWHRLYSCRGYRRDQHPLWGRRNAQQ